MALGSCPRPWGLGLTPFKSKVALVCALQTPGVVCVSVKHFHACCGAHTACVSMQTLPLLSTRLVVSYR